MCCRPARSWAARSVWARRTRWRPLPCWKRWSTSSASCGRRTAQVAGCRAPGSPAHFFWFFVIPDISLPLSSSFCLSSFLRIFTVLFVWWFFWVGFGLSLGAYVYPPSLWSSRLQSASCDRPICLHIVNLALGEGVAESKWPRRWMWEGVQVLSAPPPQRSNWLILSPGRCCI